MFEAVSDVYDAQRARRALESELEELELSEPSAETGASEEQLERYEAKRQELLKALDVAKQNEKIAHERSNAAKKIYDDLGREDAQKERLMEQFLKDRQKWAETRAKSFKVPIRH